MAAHKVLCSQVIKGELTSTLYDRSEKKPPIFAMNRLVNSTTYPAVMRCYGFNIKFELENETMTILLVHFGNEYGALSMKYFAWLICVSNGLLTILTLAGNASVLAKLTRNRRHRKLTNILRLHLAMVDLSVGLFVQLARAVLVTAPLLGELDTCTDKVQTMFEGFQMFLCMASFHGLCMITIERHVTIKHCMRYQVIITKPRIILTLLFSWVLSAIFGAGMFFTPQTVQYALSLHIILSCLVLLFMNTQMLKVANAHKTTICLQQSIAYCNERRLIKQRLNTCKPIAVVVCTIVLCYIPQSLVCFLSPAKLCGFDTTVQAMEPWTTTLFVAASSLNPFIYTRTKITRDVHLHVSERK